ncbi:hypothetical protein PAAL109150_12520 [Paenibacillus alkaliterrae]
MRGVQAQVITFISILGYHPDRCKNWGSLSVRLMSEELLLCVSPAKHANQRAMLDSSSNFPLGRTKWCANLEKSNNFGSVRLIRRAWCSA